MPSYFCTIPKEIKKYRFSVNRVTKNFRIKMSGSQGLTASKWAGSCADRLTVLDPFDDVFFIILKPLLYPFAYLIGCIKL
jgi:hypothetical protein